MIANFVVTAVILLLAIYGFSLFFDNYISPAIIKVLNFLFVTVPAWLTRKIDAFQKARADKKAEKHRADNRLIGFQPYEMTPEAMRYDQKLVPLVSEQSAEDALSIENAESIKKLNKSLTDALSVLREQGEVVQALVKVTQDLDKRVKAELTSDMKLFRMAEQAADIQRNVAGQVKREAEEVARKFLLDRLGQNGDTYRLLRAELEKDFAQVFVKRDAPIDVQPFRRSANITD